MANLSTLFDNFNDNSFDTAKWDRFQGVETGTATITETGGRLDFSFTPGYCDSSITSVNTYNLAGNHALAEFPYFSTLTSVSFVFSVYESVGTYTEYQFRMMDGTLHAYQNYGGGLVSFTGGSTPFSTVNHRWLRIKHESNIIRFQTSPDGNTWNNFISTSNNSRTISGVRAYIIGYVSDHPTTRTFAVDNFNTTEARPTISDSGGGTDTLSPAVNDNPSLSDTSGATESLVFITEVLEVPAKTYIYKVYNRGAFVGTWNDVANEISFEESINSAGDGIEVILARNADRVTQQLEVMLTESGEDLLTEDSHQLIATTTTANSVGPGTDVEVDFDVEVLVFYGSSEELLTESGEVILAEDGEPLLFDIGYVMGKPVLIGYISKIDPSYGGEEEVRVSVLSYGKELDDYMVEVSDSSALSVALGGTSYGLGSTFTGEYLTLAQTFTAPATGTASRIKLRAALGDINYGSAILSYDLRTGTTIGSGSLLDSGSVVVSSTTPTDISLPLHINPSLTNASTYHYILSTDKRKAASTDAYPVLISEGAAYANGALYTGSPAGVYSTPGADLSFTLYTTTGATTASFTSVDPSAIDRTIIDDINFKGSRISYNSSSVENTNTTVSYTFKNNTALEAVRKTVELAPTDWWWRVDVATALYHKHPKPTTVSHTFILGKHIQKMNVVQSIEGLVNMAYVAGGGTPPIYKRYENSTSLNTYRRGLFRRTDNRITTISALDLIGEHETTRFSEPRYASQIVILSEAYPIEDITVGQLVGFSNFNNYIDDLELQVVRKQYEPSKVTLTLDSVLPTVSKRIEDLRRNLLEVENEDLPTTPS